MTLDEVRRHRAKLHGPQWNDTTLAERDEIYAMAERYAWLRHESPNSIDGPEVVDWYDHLLYGDKLDAAVDAAMKGGEA